MSTQTAGQAPKTSMDELQKRLRMATEAASEEHNSQKEEQNPLDECVEIPPRVYELLPTMHRELCSLYSTPHEQHVFLCGMLPTIAHLLTNVHAPHADGFYSPDLFVALVAAAGQGKGTAAQAFRLADVIDAELRKQSETEILAYQAREQALGKGESMNEPPPPERCHVVPANSSNSVLVQTLSDNDGRAFLAETEIDSLLAAERNADWGNVTAVLRAAFHHEKVSLKRKTPHRGKTTLTIQQPAMSVFLSGTPAQFRELMQSTENGVFSRFAVYFHNPPIAWRSHRPTEQSRTRADVIAYRAQHLATVYNTLKQRETPVLVELSEMHWNSIDAAFEKVQQEFFHGENRPDLLPSARRGAIIALRLVTQFAVIRWVDSFGLNEFKSFCRLERAVIHASDDDVECAVLLARLFVSHAEKLSSLLPQRNHATSSVKSSVMRFFEALPEEFTTADAIQMAAKIGIPERTAKRYLSELTKSQVIQKRVNGRYVVPHWHNGTNGIFGTNGTNPKSTTITAEQ